MKDILGKNIEVGEHVISIVFGDRIFEEAMVVRSDPDLVIMEYLGKAHSRNKMSSWRTNKKAGQKSKLTTTNKKILILDSNYASSDKRDIYQEERERFKKEKKELEKKLINAAMQVKKISEKMKLLEAEVEKIHNRFDILDL